MLIQPILFNFPTNKVLKNAWIRAIDRHDFVATKYSRVCALHFDVNDFVTVSTDSRRDRRGESVLKRIRLRRTAIPHIFPNRPHSTTPVTLTPQELENIEIESRSRNFFADEQLDTLATSINKVVSEILPTGCIVKIYYIH